MAPMVATVAEAADFAARSAPRGMKAGVMVEVPSAALLADRMLEVVDFLSIGTNDLTQYTMAADRMATDLAHLTDPWQPAVLQLIAITAEAGQQAGKPVGVCGEAAADPLLAVCLVGMGITSLSMAARAVRPAGAQLSVVSHGGRASWPPRRPSRRATRWWDVRRCARCSPKRAEGRLSLSAGSAETSPGPRSGPRCPRRRLRAGSVRSLIETPGTRCGRRHGTARTAGGRSHGAARPPRASCPRWRPPPPATSPYPASCLCTRWAVPQVPGRPGRRGASAGGGEGVPG